MLQSISYADDSTVAYAYDPNNNRTKMTDKLGETSWSFDPLNRAIEQNDPFNRVLAYSYDADSNRVGMTYPDGNQVAYEYSPNSWLKKMTDPAGQEINYSRDLVGNLTRAPELRFTPSGAAVANFGLAVNRRWRNQQTNEWEEQTSFFDVVCWRDLAENVAESLDRGTRVMVVGRQAGLFPQGLPETDTGVEYVMAESMDDERLADVLEELPENEQLRDHLGRTQSQVWALQNSHETSPCQ